MGTEPEAAEPGNPSTQCTPVPSRAAPAAIEITLQRNARAQSELPVSKDRRAVGPCSHANYLVDVAAGHYLAHILSHGQKSRTYLWARNVGQGQPVGRREAARSAARTLAA